jgi:peptidoglycan/xylan/chitin deacetylase (PgdA/CDA1 family)
VNTVQNHPIVLTFDIENDCGLPSYKGLEIGLPKILRLLTHHNVPATFFVTGEVAENFPDLVRDLGRTYEIGCHGYHHESFQKVDSDKITALKRAKRLLEELLGTPILGFRAPYLRVSPSLFIALKKLEFQYDSSLTYFKISHGRLKPSIREFPTLFPNVFFRFPMGSYLYRIGSLLNALPVFYFHPWEAVDVRSLILPKPHSSWNLFSRPDRWLNSGSHFLTFLSEFIGFHLTHGFQFKLLRDLL